MTEQRPARWIDQTPTRDLHYALQDARPSVSAFYAAQDALDRALADPSHLPVTEVAIRDLIASQPRLDMNHQPRPETKKLRHPLVVRVAGDLLVADGHHRIQQEYADGGETIAVHVLDPYADV